MPEILLYADQWSPPDSPAHMPLAPALEEITRNVGAEDSKYDDPNPKAKALHNRPRRLNFATATVTDLITTGPEIGGPDGSQATGFTARDGDFTWTLRWDWDTSKGLHTNLVIEGPHGTDKLAFLARDQHEKYLRDNAYYRTLDSFTRDCGWSKNTYDSLPDTENPAYRTYCAAMGRRMLAIQVLKMEIPEVECGKSLSQFLHRTNTS